MADRRGRFVCFEGGEGSGKSTQVRLLRDHLEASGIAVVTTREPGGTAGAERIRELLVTGAADRWDATTEVLLLAAARRDHLLRKIMPALESGAWVVSDRFVGSTRAYQGAGHGVALEQIDAVHRIACDGIEPDLTLVLDLPVERGLARARDRAAGSTGAPTAETRFEALDLGFHERMRQGFLAMAAAAPGRFRVIDATADIAAVAAEAAAAVDGLLRGAR